MASVQTSHLLTILNTTDLQKNDQKLYDFLRQLLTSTGQIASAVGSSSSSSSGGGGGSTTNINNIIQQFSIDGGGSSEDGSPGPPGPQGNPGFAGSTGSQGPMGVADYLTDISAPDEVFPIPGQQGPTGNTGLTGNDGPAIFITALDGIDGDPGTPGAQGIQGLTGSTGASGPIGPALFITSEDGIPGEQGSPGKDGINGVTGAVGPLGPAIYLADNLEPEEPMRMPGTQGPQGNTGPTGSPGQVQAVFIDDWNQPDIPIQVPAIDNSVLAEVRLAKVVTAGSQATVDLIGIPGSFTSLKLIWQAQDTTAGTNGSSIRMSFNNDTTAGNYTSSFRIGSSATAAFASATASTTTGQEIGIAPNAGNTNIASVGELIVHNYTSNVFQKQWISVTGDEITNGGTGQVWTAYGRWTSTTAITRMTITAGGTAFTNGSVFSLFGLI